MIGLTGIPITAYVARFCVPLGNWGWRLVFVWGALGMGFLFFAHRLEESPRWYENQGRLEDAEEVLARIEMRARAELGELPPIAEVGPATARRGGYAELFSAVQRGSTIPLMLIWTCQTIGFYGFSAWVPTLLVAHGFSLVNSLAWSSVIWIGAIPGAAIGALVSDRWERKWLICIGALVIATCGLIYGLSFTKPTIIIFGFLVAMFLQTSASLLFTYTPESFPTEIRTSGTGLAYGMGRVANVFGPLVIAFIFNRYGYTSVFGYIASVWLLVAVMIAAFGPSTKGRRLT
jgi:putative MFS transporter